MGRTLINQPEKQFVKLRLYRQVLTNEDVRKSKCPILLFCNKQDSELARGAAAIKLALEREVCKPAAIKLALEREVCKPAAIKLALEREVCKPNAILRGTLSNPCTKI